MAAVSLQAIVCPRKVWILLVQAYIIQPLGVEPRFSIVPYSTRMVTSYQDRSGRYHLFTDAIDHERSGPVRELDSWDAVIRYYASDDLRGFTYQGVVIDKGCWTGDVATSEADCVGVASPGIAVVGNRLLLFYAGHGPDRSRRCPIGLFRQTRSGHGLLRGLALHTA